jgi:hypothetical protein
MKKLFASVLRLLYPSRVVSQPEADLSPALGSAALILRRNTLPARRIELEFSMAAFAVESSRLATATERAALAMKEFLAARFRT